MLSKSADQSLQKLIKSKRELIALYIPIKENQWRRIYPELFYQSNGFLSLEDQKYAGLIFDIFELVVAGSKREIIEDELNLIYMDIEYKYKSEKLSKAILSAIQERLELKKQVHADLEKLAIDVESMFSNKPSKIIPLRFRLESTTYLVRLLAYGLFTDNNMMFDRIAEVFDLEKLQFATQNHEDKQNMNNALKFLYKGLIQKNDKGRQGSRHAARQTLNLLKEWFPNNQYINWCINTIEKYV